jgi:hypothetical protein
MASAIAIKVFPVMLLPYIAIKRQWRFLGMTAAIVLMFLLLPSYYFGINGNIDLHQEWFSKVVAESDFYELNGPPNLSIQGQATRFLSIVNYEDRVLDRAYINVNLAELQPESAKLIGNVSAGAAGLITFALLFFADRRRQIARDVNNGMPFHEFGFLICMILLVGPRTNIIYFTALFVPFVALFISFFERRSPILWFACAVAFFASVVAPLIPGAKIQRVFLVLGVDMFSTLVIWVALGWLLINNMRSIPAEQPSHLP